MFSTLGVQIGGVAVVSPGGVAPGVSSLFEDTFTGDGPLASHTSESGHTWTGVGINLQSIVGGELVLNANNDKIEVVGLNAALTSHWEIEWTVRHTTPVVSQNFEVDVWDTGGLGFAIYSQPTYIAVSNSDTYVEHIIYPVNPSSTVVTYKLRVNRTTGTLVLLANGVIVGAAMAPLNCAAISPATQLSFYGQPANYYLQDLKLGPTMAVMPLFADSFDRGAGAFLPSQGWVTPTPAHSDGGPASNLAITSTGTVTAISMGTIQTTLTQFGSSFAVELTINLNNTAVDRPVTFLDIRPKYVSSWSDNAILMFHDGIEDVQFGNGTAGPIGWDTLSAPKYANGEHVIRIEITPTSWTLKWDGDVVRAYTGVAPGAWSDPGPINVTFHGKTVNNYIKHFAVYPL